MPEYYNTVERYQEECPFWGTIERLLNKKYQPNTWLFKSVYRPYPQRHFYALCYRNFDDSEELHFTFEYLDGQVFCSL